MTDLPQLANNDTDPGRRRPSRDLLAFAIIAGPAIALLVSGVWYFYQSGR